MLDAHDLPVGIERPVRVFGEGKSLTRQQSRAVGFATAGDGVVTQGIEPVLGKGLAARVQLVAARVVEVLVGIALVRKLCPHLLVGEAIGRGLEAVVLEFYVRRPHRFPVVELAHIGALFQ
ncbi:hypothetical protein D3C80_1789110 [compost metagenome]